jgi:NAD(P)-dependent dehydrogenase (short-subunit alcohol dehydrogenase family)
MRDLKGRVAVITGAASGIGRGLAERCAHEGMKVVLADVEEAALVKAEEELKASGASTLAVLTDVSKPDDVEALARKTLDAFGAAHLLCNNAGINGGLFTWESSLADWQWIMGVNLWGVIHGVRTFVPIMLEQGDDCHIVNTASMAGLLSAPAGIYAVTKHGVVSLSETLFHELALSDASIGVSVLCPGYVNTNIAKAGRNRPPELQNEPSVKMEREKLAATPAAEAVRQANVAALREGMSPLQVADEVLAAVREKKFYILANAGPFRAMAHTRLEDVKQERNPTIPT